MYKRWMIVLGFHIIPWLYLKQITVYSSFSSIFQALLLFHSNWPLSNIFLLKLEKQFDSLSQVAAIVHNDFYYLSQEILGFAFQVCIPNLLLLVIIIDDLGFCLMYVSVFLFRILAYKCRYVTNYLFFIFHVLKLCCYFIYSLKSVSFWVWY